MSKSAFGFSQKTLKSKLIKSSISILRKLSLLKWVDKNYKFVAGTDWKTEVFLEFPIKKTSFGVTQSDVDNAKYTFHFIIQSEYYSEDDVEEATVDYDLTFYVEYKGGSDFEKVVDDGEIILDNY